MAIGGELRDVAIRLVETEETLEAACDLVNRRYIGKGYGAGHRIPASTHHMTFTAEVDQRVVGTITLAVDSNRGLAADKTFRDELDSLRAKTGSKICELTKLAFSDDVHSKELMAALFHIVFVYGYRTHHCTDLLIELHPRHVRFYEAMLGFKRVALRKHPGFEMPVQLMSLEVAEVRRQVDCCAGTATHGDASAAPKIGRRSLYPLFFSPADERGIYDRLARAERTRIEIEPHALATRLQERDERSGSLPRRLLSRMKALRLNGPVQGRAADC